MRVSNTNKRAHVAPASLFTHERTAMTFEIWGATGALLAVTNNAIAAENVLLKHAGASMTTTRPTLDGAGACVSHELCEEAQTVRLTK